MKLEALAAKQVAAETKIQGVWSWGWPSFSVAGDDPDKPAAACVYLWARDPKLCDGPALAGAGFDASLTEGQITLPAGVRCTLGTRRDPEERRRAHGGAHGRPRLGGERAAAARGAARAEPDRPDDRARRGARDRSRPLRRQRRALPRRARATLHVTLPDARAIIADRLAREPRAGALPAAAAVGRAGRRVPLDVCRRRASDSSRSIPRRRGSAARSAASRSRRSRPSRSSRCARTAARRSTPSTGASPCGRSGRRCRCSRSRPPRRATVARGVLGRFAKHDVYERWLRTQELRLLANAVCVRDAVPAQGDVDLSAWVPFLGA